MAALSGLRSIPKTDTEAEQAATERPANVKVGPMLNYPLDCCVRLQLSNLLPAAIRYTAGVMLSQFHAKDHLWLFEKLCSFLVSEVGQGIVQDALKVARCLSEEILKVAGLSEDESGCKQTSGKAIAEVQTHSPLFPLTATACMCSCLCHL